MISIQHLQKSFGDNTVLKHIDLTVEKGEVVVIIGPSGSGKTTFLRCLNVLETPNAGHIRIGNKELNFSQKSNEERYCQPSYANRYGIPAP